MADDLHISLLEGNIGNMFTFTILCTIGAL
jgi:hypothetical protein